MDGTTAVPLLHSTAVLLYTDGCGFLVDGFSAVLCCTAVLLYVHGE